MLVTESDLVPGVSSLLTHSASQEPMTSCHNDHPALMSEETWAQRGHAVKLGSQLNVNPKPPGSEIHSQDTYAKGF